MVIPRRNLVDQVRDEVGELVAALDNPQATPLMREVRDRLMARKQRRIDGKPVEGPPVAVASLRGGQRVSPLVTKWQDEPNMCAVLTVTPHIAVSTVLFNSYRFSPKNHAFYAGLFAVGVRVVFDEAHLQRQAVTTYRGVARLINGRESVDRPAITVTEMTATPAMDGQVPGAELRLTDSDVAVLPDGSLSPIGKRLLARKTLSTLEVDDDKAAVEAIVSEAAKLRKSVDGTVGVVVNTVDAALSIAQKLRGKGYELSVLTVTGRTRPFDRARVLGEHPDALTHRGDDSVDVVVATQTIEVGVDADFAAMVTMLAPGDALAQRFGRVNRAGKRNAAPVTVITFPVPDKGAGPYTADDLRAALAWLEDRVADNGDVCPLKVSDSTPPVRTLSRLALSELHAADAHNMSVKCGYAASAYDDPLFWITDDLNVRPDTRVLLRRSLPDGGSVLEREALLAAFRPDDAECWTVDSFTAEKVLSKVSKYREFTAASVVTPTGHVRDLPVEGKVDARALGWNTLVLWVNGEVPLTTEMTLSTTGKELASWVPESEILGNSGLGPGCLLIGPEIPSPTADHVATAKDVWPTRSDAKWWYAAREVCGSVNGYVITSAVENDDKPLWAVVSATTYDPDGSSYSGRTVALSDHRVDVADACASLSEDVRPGDPDLERVLRLAGLYHDDGKGHPGFQDYLYGSSDPNTPHPPEVIAKSGDRSKYRSRSKSVYGLSPRWRHEQLSAAIAAKDLDGDPAREVVSLLAGLSHGYGRSLFPDDYATLVDGLPDADAIAVDLFTDGTWDEWLHRVTDLIGPWKLAWMEALVRAADHHVSSQDH